MSRKSEGVLKAVLFILIAAIVGAGFYFAGPAGGIWFAVITALLLWSVFVERKRRCPYEDDTLDMISHPVWKHWEGNIWHRKG